MGNPSFGEQSQWQCELLNILYGCHGFHRGGSLQVYNKLAPWHVIGNPYNTIGTITPDEFYVRAHVRYGNFVDSQGPDKVGWKLKEPLTWERMGQISWNSCASPFRETYRLIRTALTKSISLGCLFKGTVARDFLPPVFSTNRPYIVLKFTT